MNIDYEITSEVEPFQIEGVVNGRDFYFCAKKHQVWCDLDPSEAPDWSQPSFSLCQRLRLKEGNHCSSEQVSLEEALGFIQMTYSIWSNRKLKTGLEVGRL